MLFYTVHPSPRLDYMLDLVSNEIFTEPFIQTSDRSVYLSYTGPKLNYSPERISETEFYLFPHKLLFETGYQNSRSTGLIFSAARHFSRLKEISHLIFLQPLFSL